MSAETNPQPAPSPEPGATPSNPELSVVPPPEPQRRSPSDLNLEQLDALEKTRQVCVAAQKPDYAALLAPKSIAAPFVATLMADIKVAANCSGKAVDYTTNKEVATRNEQAAERTLVEALRDLQSAARQLHQHNDPEKLKDYLIGQRITDSRAVLNQSAEVIINKANQERPAGVDTEMIIQTEGKLAAVRAQQQAQSTEQSRARTERADRDALVNSIIDRCQTIQFAADRVWPWNDPKNAGVRREFHLPAGRTYSA